MIKKKILNILLSLVIFIIIFLFFMYKYKKFNEKKQYISKEFSNQIKVRPEDFYQNNEYKASILKNLEWKSINKTKVIEEKIVEVSENTRLFYLQIGTFRNEDNAISLSKKFSHLGKMKVEKSEYNENYFILITDNYSKEKVEKINKEILTMEKNIKPLVKVRY